MFNVQRTRFYWNSNLFPGDETVVAFFTKDARKIPVFLLNENKTFSPSSEINLLDHDSTVLYKIDAILSMYFTFDITKNNNNK